MVKTTINKIVLCCTVTGQFTVNLFPIKNRIKTFCLDSTWKEVYDELTKSKDSIEPLGVADDFADDDVLSQEQSRWVPFAFIHSNKNTL